MCMPRLVGKYLYGGAGRTGNLPPLPRQNLDIIDRGSHGNSFKERAVPDFKWNGPRGFHLHPYDKSLWRENIFSFAIRITNECDKCGPIRVILNSQNLCRNTFL